jgi:hypothetical protein
LQSSCLASRTFGGNSDSGVNGSKAAQREYGHFLRATSTGYDAPEPTGDAMKKRSRAGGEPIKGRRRKTAGPERRNAPKTTSRPTAPRGEKPTEVVRLARELNEALERQTATSDVLNVISSRESLIQSSTRYCKTRRVFAKHSSVRSTSMMELLSAQLRCIMHRRTLRG